MSLRISSPVTTRCTPASARAAVVSMRLIMPCGTVERNTFPYSMPGRRRLWVYSARPVTFARASRRGIERPIWTVISPALWLLGQHRAGGDAIGADPRHVAEFHLVGSEHRPRRPAVV